MIQRGGNKKACPERDRLFYWLPLLDGWRQNEGLVTVLVSTILARLESICKKVDLDLSKFTGTERKIGKTKS